MGEVGKKRGFTSVLRKTQDEIRKSGPRIANEEKYLVRVYICGKAARQQGDQIRQNQMPGQLFRSVVRTSCQERATPDPVLVARVGVVIMLPTFLRRHDAGEKPARTGNRRGRSGLAGDNHLGRPGF